jgi:4-hydroxy-3-polyprenylbenzoate decarboxylase
VKTVVAITGASGVIYGVRLLEALPQKKVVILSQEAAKIARMELRMTPKDINALADEHFSNDDMFSPLASGSVNFDALVVAPCSTSTMSKIACGIADNLITRAAAVALKERRKLVLLIRETPLSTIHLSNMERLSAAGAIIMPASPAFYPEPKTIDDMIDFVVGRVLDVLGIETDMYTRWSGGGTRTRRTRVSR